MAASVVGVHTEDGVSSSPLTMTYSDVGAIQSGDLILARVVSRSTVEELDSRVTPPAGFTNVSVDEASSSLQRALWTGTAGAESSAEWSYADPGDGWSLTYIALRGVETSDLFDVAISYDAGSSFGSAEPPDVTTLSDGAVIVVGGDGGDNRINVTRLLIRVLR